MSRPGAGDGLAERLEGVRDRIERSASRAGRDPEEIALVAVAKTFPAAAIRTLAAAGQHRFAESYVQEAAAKQAELEDLDLEWHFVGPLQSNKAVSVAEHFALIHSVDRLRVARALDRYRTKRAPLDVCLQVNISGEVSKSGCAPEEAPELASRIAGECPGLRLRGLMAIPAPSPNPEAARPAFRRLADLQRRLRERAPQSPWDMLSMGMSADFETAIEEGATHVRVGSALFGTRSPKTR